MLSGFLIISLKKMVILSGIDADSVMEEIRMTSSSEDRHRQLHHDDPTFDVESSRESNSSSHGIDEDDDGDNGN